MTTDTKPDPLKWLRAVARLPTRKSDGVAATETLAHIARLQAQVDALAGALKTALPYINADVNEPGGPVALAVSALAAVGR